MELLDRERNGQLPEALVPMPLKAGVEPLAVSVDGDGDVSIMIRLVGSVENSRPGEELIPYLKRVLPAIEGLLDEGISAGRLFPLFADIKLDYLQKRAADRDLNYQLKGHGPQPSLCRYFTLGCPRSEVARIRALVRRWEKVDRVYVEPRLIPSGAQSDPDLRGLCGEGHLEAAPYGVEARYAWRFPGGDGASMRFIDVENGWFLEHSELVDATITEIGGVNNDGAAWHGTGVLSIIAARLDDNLGISGITPNVASIRVVSIEWVKDLFRIANAVLAAICELRFGDVLLIEVQASDFDYPGVARPAEAEPAVFEAVRLAAALGVVVVAAAGNGGCELGDMEDSGAILVGASDSHLPHQRDDYSNFGRRIDCFAWGEDVHAASTYAIRKYLYGSERKLGGLDELLAAERAVALIGRDQCFGGTSAASAIIAGVAISIQGLAQANLGFRFSPWQLRLILRDPANGTPSADPPRDRIGMMPDMRKIIGEVLGLTTDVYFRDRVGDSGELPRSSRWESPDIVIRPEEEKDPQGSLGEGSGQENDETLAPREVDERTRIYLRLRNRGSEDAKQVRVKLYASPVTTLPSPKQWRRVGETELPVPAWDALTVARGMSWPYCQTPSADISWVALAGTDEDPIPSRTLLEHWHELLHLLRSRKGFACRNVHRLSCYGDERFGKGRPEAWTTLKFIAPGAPDEDVPMRLEVLARLPRQARVWLEMPPEIAELRGIWGRPPIGSHESGSELPVPGSVFVPVNPHGHNYFRERLFRAGTEYPVRIRLWLPPGVSRAPYRIAARQLYKNEEVGRVTWRWLPG